MSPPRPRGWSLQTAGPRAAPADDHRVAPHCAPEVRSSLHPHRVPVRRNYCRAQRAAAVPSPAARHEAGGGRAPAAPSDSAAAVAGASEVQDCAATATADSAPRRTPAAAAVARRRPPNRGKAATVGPAPTWSEPGGRSNQHSSCTERGGHANRRPSPSATTSATTWRAPPTCFSISPCSRGAPGAREPRHLCQWAAGRVGQLFLAAACPAASRTPFAAHTPSCPSVSSGGRPRRKRTCPRCRPGTHGAASPPRRPVRTPSLPAVYSASPGPPSHRRIPAVAGERRPSRYRQMTAASSCF